MSILNINAISHPSDVAYLTTNIEKDYYLNALANLGQRTSISHEKAIQYSKIVYDKMMSVNSYYPNIYYFEDDITLDTPINNIQMFKKYSQILDEDNHFKSLTFNKLLGMFDDDINNIEIDYIDIDIYRNIIRELWNVFYVKSDIYVLLHLTLDTVIDDSNIGKLYPQLIYTLKAYHLSFNPLSSSDNESNVISSVLKNLFSASYYQNSIEDLGLDKVNVSSDDLLEILKSRCIYTEDIVSHNYSIKVAYNSFGENDDSYRLRITDESYVTQSYLNIKELLLDDTYGIDGRIRTMTIDLTDTYPTLLKYYSSNQFNGDNDTLCSMILQKLYNKLYISTDEKIRNNMTLVAPEGLEIIYVGDLNDIMRVYYTNDIYVNFVDIPSNKTISDLLNDVSENEYDNSSFILFYNGDSKTSIYDVSFNYNDIYQQFIDDIIIDKKYTLPYINESKYWVINDVVTNNYALGEDGGTPNIMLIETSLPGSSKPYDILNRFDLSRSMIDMYKTTCSIINEYDDTISEYVFYIPEITDDNVDIFKYANLITLSNVIEVNKEDIVSDMSVTLLWTINEDKTKFVPITAIDGKLMTLNELMSVDSYIENAILNFQSRNNIFNRLLTIKLPTNSLINATESANLNKDATRYFTIKQVYNPKDNIKTDLDHNYNKVSIKVDDTTYLDNNGISIVDTSTTSTYSFIYRNDNSLIKDNEFTANAHEESHNSSQTSMSGTSTSPRRVQEAGISTNNTPTPINLYEKYYDLSPKSFVPIIDSSEVMMSNTNILTRLNVINFSDKKDQTDNSYMYYAYFGTAPYINNNNSGDPNVLKIGTSNINISAGTDTLFEGKDTFAKKHLLDIDIDRIHLNGKTRSSSCIEEIDQTTKVHTVKLNSIIQDDDFSDIFETTEINDNKCILHTVKVDKDSAKNYFMNLFDLSEYLNYGNIFISNINNNLLEEDTIYSNYIQCYVLSSSTKKRYLLSRPIMVHMVVESSTVTFIIC